MDRRTKKIVGIVGVVGIVLVGGVAALLLRDSSGSKIEQPVEKQLAEEAKKLEVGTIKGAEKVSACPDFDAPKEPEMGEEWSVYARPDLCYSYEYPNDWVVIKSDTGGASVRRKENQFVTSYSTENSFATFGVTEISSTSMNLSKEQMAEALAAPGKTCFDVSFSGRPQFDCLFVTNDERRFIASYGYNPEGTDLDILQKILATVRVW